jgi:hypothetical protein
MGERGRNDPNIACKYEFLKNFFKLCVSIDKHMVIPVM